MQQDQRKKILLKIHSGKKFYFFDSVLVCFIDSDKTKLCGNILLSVCELFCDFFFYNIFFFETGSSKSIWLLKKCCFFAEICFVSKFI